MTPLRLMTCSAGCAQALREDTRRGLIYGPFAIPNHVGKLQFVGRLEWAAYADECIYCRAALPRGRAKRIITQMEQWRDMNAPGTASFAKHNEAIKLVRQS